MGEIAQPTVGARSAQTDGPGLVICDITGRAHRMPGAAEVAKVVDTMGPYEDVNDHRYVVQVSPGAVRLAARGWERRESASRRGRGEITEWSRRSRRGMTLRLAETDYGPLARLGRVPAMVTLTYPGDWETVVPTGRDAKTHLKAWVRRYERRWGETLIMVWKLEFQARGAPHFHLYMSPPLDSGFRRWLSRSWSEVVDHPDPVQRARHEAAGTGVDFAPGLGWSDPKRIAVYFAKHAAPNNASSKEYQHRVPELWQKPHAGPGRFWGVAGLERAVGRIEVSEREWIVIRRLLHRMSRSVTTYGQDCVRSHPATSTVLVPRLRRGKLVKRRQTRRVHRFGGSRLLGGFHLANDGPALGLGLLIAARSIVAEEEFHER